MRGTIGREHLTSFYGNKPISEEIIFFSLLELFECINMAKKNNNKVLNKRVLSEGARFTDEEFIVYS